MVRHRLVRRNEAPAHGSDLHALGTNTHNCSWTTRAHVLHRMVMHLTHPRRAGHACITMSGSAHIDSHEGLPASAAHSGSTAPIRGATPHRGILPVSRVCPGSPRCLFTGTGAVPRSRSLYCTGCVQFSSVSSRSPHAHRLTPPKGSPSTSGLWKANPNPTTTRSTPSAEP